MAHDVLDDVLVEMPPPMEVASFDVQKIRDDFPILRQIVHGHPLVYLDNAASAQRPRQVIDAISFYYSSQHANIHRGVHYLSGTATQLYEDVRTRIQRFINADSSREIVFVRGRSGGDASCHGGSFI